MRSSFHSSFGAARRVVPFAAIDPSIISSAISAGGAIATTAISASASAKAAKGAKKRKKKKQAPSDETPPETGATTQPATGGVPSWALYAGVGLLVLVGGFMLLRKSNAKDAR